MQRVEDSEIETRDSLTYRWQGQPFTGIGYELGEQGQVIREVSYKDGRLDGVSRQWNYLGQLFFETHYRKGTTYGLDREWDENGQLRRETFAEYGLRAWEKQWDETGQLIKDHVMGPEDSHYEWLQSSRAAYDKIFGVDKGKPLPPER